MFSFVRRNPRASLAVLHDLTAASLAWMLAYYLRFNLDMPPNFVAEMWHTIVWVLPLQSIGFWLFGLYRGMWRYASINDLKRILKAVLLVAGLIPLMFWMIRINVIVPRSVLLIYPLLLLLMMGGSRLIYRLWKEKALYSNNNLQGEPVLVLGVDTAAVNLSKEIAHSRTWRVVGFLGGGESQRGRTLNGITILGGLDELQHWVERMDIKQAIIAMPNATHQQRRRAVELCNEVGIRALTVPSFDDLLSGRLAISQLRAVELDDLLGRDPVKLDNAGLHELITHKTVLVTGAGGSIGSELCRQIARFEPQKIVLFESSEFALYSIEQELSFVFPKLKLACIAGDVRDKTRVNQVFDEFRPNVVFHAAAYKHVPLMEQHNSWQAVRNNVFGTWCVASAAQHYEAEKFVLISTDKAVNPTNVMGTTKRLAEMVCQGLQQVNGTNFVMVRFGNVLGSTGSVIPKFREQIAKGGPITVTHPEITRYFMSIPEAAQLVLQAGWMGAGGKIFVLDMGEPVKIIDLARDMIRLSGLSEGEIKIEFSGLRPGEKLFEELLADSEHTLTTPHPKLRIAQARDVDTVWLNELLAWINNPEAVWQDADVKLQLKKWVPEYCPSGSAKC
jgi:FlaA1/EpsC-like NDP-sugar epimerase